MGESRDSFELQPDRLRRRVHGVAALLDVGTTANTVCAGNDSRLSNSRRCNNSFDDVIMARFNLGVKSMALREVTISTAEPPASSGSEGDIWFQYTT